VTDRARRLLLSLALVGVAAVWGSGFVMVRDAVASYPVFSFLGIRFLVATLAFAVLFPSAVRRLDRGTVVAGLIAGVILCAGYVFQTVGLAHTSASVSGFLTSAYVVLTPVLGALLLRRCVPRAVWAAVAVSTLGIGVLSLRGLAIGPGEAVTLLAAAFFALHIVGLGAWASPREAYGSSVVQLAVAAAVSSVVALPGGLTVPTGTADLLALAYLAVVAGAGAMLVQTWAQAHVAPERAAVVMTLEPVWAAGFAVALLGESLGPRVVLGGVLVLSAMVVCERPDAVARLGAAVRRFGEEVFDRARPAYRAAAFTQ